MNLKSIATELKKELDRLNRAIVALVGGTSSRGTTRKARSKRASRRRPMSTAARKKLSNAMKKRWAERRKKA